MGRTGSPMYSADGAKADIAYRENQLCLGFKAAACFTQKRGRVCSIITKEKKNKSMLEDAHQRCYSHQRVVPYVTIYSSAVSLLSLCCLSTP